VPARSWGAQAVAAFYLHRLKQIPENGVRSLALKLQCRIYFLGLSLLSFIAEAATDDFASIPKRNVFRLLPPKLEQKPTEVQPELPQLTLQGVTTLLDSRQALLKIQSKAKLNAIGVCCILGEGQERDGVRVLRIEMESGTVWLANQGNDQVLTLR
jgi:hypothetical protein